MQGQEVQVLGPVALVTGGDVHHIAGRASRALLGSLVLAVGHPVAVEHLAQAVWGEEQPESAHDAMHSLISRLRREVPIEHVDGAYELQIDPEHIDACRFERLVTAAAAALRSDPVEARRMALEALELWRGDPYLELTDFEPARLETLRLEELRSRAMELAWEADIELGNHNEVAGSLEAAVAAEPYRERLWFLLIVALARSGRRVEALRAYDQLHRTLGELGIEPTAEMQELPLRIAGDDPALRPHFDLT